MSIPEMKAMLKNKYGFILDGETEQDLFYNLEYHIVTEIRQLKELQSSCDNVIMAHFDLLNYKRDPEFYGFKPYSIINLNLKPYV